MIFLDGKSIKEIRGQLGLSQEAFAAALGVSFATVNRWENDKAKPQKDRVNRIRAMLGEREERFAPQLRLPLPPPRLDFEGDAEAVKLVVDTVRLQNGHVFNKAFGLELSKVVPLPHQRIAVYEQLLPQNPLRFLLADDAGAGKTIMSGLYIREMINRGRLTSVLICAPAGLTWNWRRELKNFFDLDFKILRGSDFQNGDPTRTSERRLFIISVDTAATDMVKSCLLSESCSPFDLIIFDEAHKLSWLDPKRNDSKTRRYMLAEGLSGRCSNLLLLTATPHMGKFFPYFALWRILDANVISTPDALRTLSDEKKNQYFIRRLKEEMVDYDGQAIYKPRLCQTITFSLTTEERAFYDAASDYLRWSYETSTAANRNAAAMVVAVLQRRLASSTYAMLESLGRRRKRITGADNPTAASQLSLERIANFFDTSTADEGEADDGHEADENIEEQALALATPTSQKQQHTELEYLDRIIDLGDHVRQSQQESKFLKLREMIESPEFRTEQLLIFTEHRDTLEFLRQRFEALGYSGQIASIHGGMDVEEREAQRILFMPPEVRRAQGVKNPGGPTARILLATDAAGEGINLQFAWVMVNYDIPWNPARLEQRMGRLHRFGQHHQEVRIFNLVAENTREGDVLYTLLHKLDEARKDLCSDKVFDVIGQQLQEVSLRDLLRDALFETSPYSGQKKLDSIFATQRLRTSIEEQRQTASTYGDVAKRLGQLRGEIDVEQFSRLLPAYIQHFLEKAAPKLGIQLDGDLSESARFSFSGSEASWLRELSSQFPEGLPESMTVRRDYIPADGDAQRVAFLRPGDLIFDAICQETLRRFKADAARGTVYCDPSANQPYGIAVYLCQFGEPSPSNGNNALFDRRLIAVRWDESGEFGMCAPNHLLALPAAPHSLFYTAGQLLRNPEERAAQADAYVRMFAETNYLQQLRTALRAESDTRVEDLVRGFDYRAGELAEKRSDLARRVRQGDHTITAELEEIKRQQTSLEAEKATTLIYAQRRADLLDITCLERVAFAVVVPDPSPEAKESYDQNIEAIAMRIARNYEIDRYHSRVFDVSSPHLARGYDLESHRANGDKVVIEVKGRAGRGAVHLTENEWPTAANVREKYWLYVVVDCATNPKLFRVCDPIRLAFRTRQTFSLNIGEIISHAEQE